MRKRLLAIVATLAMVMTMIPAVAFADTAVAKIGSTEYSTIQGAVDAANDGDCVVIIDDAVITTAITVNKNITIDLNGKKVENSATNDYVIKVEGNKTLTLEDFSDSQNGTIKGAKGINVKTGSKLIMNGGNVVATGATGAGIQVYGSSAIMTGGSVTAEYGAILMYSNGDTRGTFTMEGGKLNSKSPAIYANGSESWDNVDVTILDGEITSDDITVFWPAAGKLTIEGGKITGKTAVYVKSGSLEITGGELVANGEAKDYEYKNSGAVTTGDALVIENVASGGYEAVTSVSITGGTFISANADAVGSYAAGQVEGVEAKTGFITGGTFNTDVTALLAANLEWEEETGKVIDPNAPAEDDTTTNDGSAVEGGAVAEPAKPADSPKTGDDSSMAVPFALAGLAVLAMGAVVLTRRQRQN